MTLAHHPSHQPASRVREVDALRGIAAILVLIFHYSFRYHEMFPGTPRPDFGLNAGYDGVVLFFTLSGFSIHFSFRRLSHMGDFAFARFARLFPAYWAAMAITLAVQAVADIPLFRLPPTDILVNVTMLQGFAHVGLVDGAYWTLAVELSFYACMALLWRFGLLARLEWILAGWLGLAWVMHHWTGFPEPVAQFLILRHVQFFAIGLIASRVHSGQRSWGQQLPILLLTISYIAMMEGTAVLLVAGSTLAFFAASSRGWLRWLCVPPLLWVGAISYPLYLVHQHVGMTIMQAAQASGIGYGTGMAMAVVAALLLGTAIHRLVERPAGDWLLARWRRGDARPARRMGARLSIGLLALPIALAGIAPATLTPALALPLFCLAGFILPEWLPRLRPAPAIAMILALAAILSGEMLQASELLAPLAGLAACLLMLHITGLGDRMEMAILGWLLGKWLLFYWPAMPDAAVNLLALRWIGFAAIGLLLQRIYGGERRWRDQLPYGFILLITIARTDPAEGIVTAVLLAAGLAITIRWQPHAAPAPAPARPADMQEI